MFDFDQLSTGSTDAYQQDHDSRLFGILDQFPEGTRSSEIWQAWAEECAGRISNYKSYAHLVRFWFGAGYTMSHLAQEEPEMFLDVFNHMQERLEALT